jgi:hypothetical protein
MEFGWSSALALTSKLQVTALAAEVPGGLKPLRVGLLLQA